MKMEELEMAKASTKRVDPHSIRDRLGLSQRDFWGPLGVKQSGGSRYENGRSMPKPVEMLLGIVYLGRKPPKSPKG